MQFMSKVKEINEGNKIKVVKREKPKVRPKKLPPSVLEETKKFKKTYPQRDIEQVCRRSIDYGMHARAHTKT